MISLSLWVHVLVPDDRCHPLSLLLLTGKRLVEGAERPTAGDFHVQCVKKTRLWGRFQMVITVHRLT